MNTYWLDTAGAIVTPPADLPTTADVAILGAGIMGSALAYWLARQGARPVVLERNAQPGAGATGRNGGLHVGGPARVPAAALQAHGPQAVRAILDATRHNRRLLEAVLDREGIQAQYRRAGFLALAGDQAEMADLRASAQVLEAAGERAEWLDRPAAEACLGTALAPHFCGALFKPDDGVLHSARYVRGVAQAAARHGARFVFETPALAVAPETDGGNWRIDTPRGRLVASQLVVALNAWAPALFPVLGEVITPVRGHVVLSAPMAASLRPFGANHGYEYGRQLDDGRLLLGGLRHTRPDLDQGYAPAPGANAPPVVPELVTALSRHIGVLFPRLPPAPVTQHWTGVMDFSPDLNPLAGAWPGRRGLWLLVGFSGHGLPYSQVLPAALAAQIIGAGGPAIPRAFDPGRYPL